MFSWQRAVKLSGGTDPLTLHLLAHVLADSGRPSEAIQADRQALEIAIKQHTSRLTQAINAHLAELLRQR